MAYDKLELLKHLCVSETPVTLKSLLNTCNQYYACLNGGSYHYENNEKSGVSIHDYYSHRRENERRAYTFSVDCKIKGLLYQVYVASSDEFKRYNQKIIKYDEEVLVYKIERRMHSTYESLILAETKI